MRTCVKCNELNGENRTECWKCKTPFPPADTYKKVCPKCGVVYPQKAESCEKCGGRLSVCTDVTGIRPWNIEDSGCWMYIISVLFPLVGIILGCIYISRREDEKGKSLIITGVISNIIAVILVIMLVSCSSS